LPRNALEQATERAAHHTGQRAAGAHRSVCEDCAKQVIKLCLAPNVHQTNGKFAHLGLA
jgi:hypothetical protein